MGVADDAKEKAVASLVASSSPASSTDSLSKTIGAGNPLWEGALSRLQASELALDSVSLPLSSVTEYSLASLSFLVPPPLLSRGLSSFLRPFLADPELLCSLLLQGNWILRPQTHMGNGIPPSNAQASFCEAGSQQPGDEEAVKEGAKEADAATAAGDTDALVAVVGASSSAVVPSEVAALPASSSREPLPQGPVCAIRPEDAIWAAAIASASATASITTKPIEPAMELQLDEVRGP